MDPRPIDIWPHRKPSGGKPGYSRKHYARLAGEQDDPLRAAGRLMRNQIAEIAHADYPDMTPLDPRYSWFSDQLQKAQLQAWDMLCNDLDLVIATLEAATPMTPAIKADIREAKRHKVKRDNPSSETAKRMMNPRNY